jgi:transcriptional regulator GlxA family with amidase domain
MAGFFGDRPASLRSGGAGGITSSIDLALWIVEREIDPELAAGVARSMEYEPRRDIWRR